MKSIRFISEYSHEYGQVGLYPKNVHCKKEYSPIFSSKTLAHDIVEHQNGFKNIGTFVDEFEAFGGFIFCKEQCFYSSTFNILAYRSFDEVLFSSVEFLLTEAEESGVEIFKNSVPKQKNPYYEFDFCSLEMKLKESFEEALVDNVINSITVGLLKAEKRFKHSWIIAYDLSNQIEEQCEECVNFTSLEEGQEFILSYDFNDNCKMRNIHEYSEI